MPSHPRPLDDLLATRATQPLSPAQDQELRRLLRIHGDVDVWALDEAAAAIDLAWMARQVHEPMPARLRLLVEADAAAFAARPFNGRARPALVPGLAGAVPAERTRRAVAWPWLAAAAVLALSLVAWLARPSVAPRPAALYAAMASSPGAIRASWTDAGGAGVTGDIVWDNGAQTGVMRFRGLAANDPAEVQYQLWIFDAGRGAPDENGVVYNAVDGGVFDVEASGGDVFVKVDPKLRVFRPTLFAVTTEPAGGVVRHVTHGDYRVILTAPLPG